MTRYSTPRALAAVGLGTLLFALPLAAQNAAQQGWNPQEIIKKETYQRPPAEVERIVLAPRTNVSFTNASPDRKWFLRTESDGLGDIEDFGKPHIYLGGVQVDTLANRARALTTRGAAGLTLIDPRTMAMKTIETPKGASISAATWSPNATQIAYIANFDNASHLFVADVATGKSTQITTKTPLLATLVTTVEWTADGKSLVTVIVPDVRAPKPTHGKNGVEDGPQVRLTEARVIKQRIHPSLLEDPHDKEMLKYYTTGQVALVDAKSKAVTKIGKPGMVRSVSASPDGKFFRVTLMTEPFSYIVPASSFGSVEELWDASGKVLATLATRPLNEGEQTDDDTPAAGGRGGQAAAADTGKRNIQWNAMGPGLVYLQSIYPPAPAGGRGTGARGAGGGRTGGAGAAAGQGQQPAAPQPTSVRFMSWAPPFAPADAKLVYEGSGRFTGLSYSADGKTMFVADSGTVIAVRDGRRFNLGRGVSLGGGGGGRGGGGGGRGGAGADTAQTGGALATKPGPNGGSVVVLASDNKTVFLNGNRAPNANWQKEGPRAWVDKLDIETSQRSRIFDATADAFEQFVSALDDDYSQFIYTRESPSIVPDSYLRDTKAGTNKKLTTNRDFAPDVTQAQRKRLYVTRQRDQFKFYVDVTLPRDWRPGNKLPGIIWFYPREYSTQDQYEQSRFGTNINRFPAPAARSPEIWVTQNYAVIQPDNPIVGPTGRMNDNYTQDLKENLDATIDAVVEAGFVDRDRIGIGGHSYGAFSTVNAMTLTPFFKAGIAGDGMYNRSLTPFSFQTERRSFFEAQDMYLDMSPFYRADKLTGALLMYHSIEDQNVGTAPISSTRMLHALQGLGKTAALYMYPYEDHGPATKETDLDQWARWIAWFDIYVKNQKKVIVP